MASAAKKMSSGLGSFIKRGTSLFTPNDPNANLPASGDFACAAEGALFPKVDPAVDGEDCLHDCESCTVHYPAKFKIDEDEKLYGHVKGWATHMLVATGKTDWVRDVEDEKGSVMEAVRDCGVRPENGRLMLSASNIPILDLSAKAAPAPDRPTSVLLLPSFTLVENVTPNSVGDLIQHYVSTSPTNTTPLHTSKASKPLLPNPEPSKPELLAPVPAHPFVTSACPHDYLILLCSQKTRDARCGQSAPLLRREFERHLRPLGLYRDLHDQRPGGVGIYFISHVGGHKFSANVMIYRRRGTPGTIPAQPAPKGQTVEKDASVEKGLAEREVNGQAGGQGGIEGTNGAGESNEADEVEGTEEDRSAAQCIWIARVRPEDCEGIVKYTVLQGKVVKPERQLRGGFDRERGLVSW